jgi:MarR family transcriptional regulator for hemolysin
MDMKPLEEQFAEALHLTAHGWRNALNRRLRPLGYSRSRWMVLLHVSRADGISHRELADLMGIEPATLVRLIDGMEAEGLLKRRTGEADRRVKHLHLSTTGKQEVARVWASAADLRKEILSGMSKAEITATLDVLQKIRDKLNTLS